MIAAARTRLGNSAELSACAIEAMTYPDAFFDAVLLLNVFYFSDREGEMARNLLRVIKPGGRIVAYVTHRETMERWRFAHAGYHRLFDAEELAAALALGGFVRGDICVQEVPVARSVRGLLVRAAR